MPDVKEAHLEVGRDTAATEENCTPKTCENVLVYNCFERSVDRSMQGHPPKGVSVVDLSVRGKP